MSYKELTTAAQQYFPELKVKYKNESLLMKMLGFILFFNRKFMTNYTTTLGSTVYVPSEAYTLSNPVSSSVVLLHELVHVHDAKNLNKFWFGFLYLTPQIFALLAIPLFFISWPAALVVLVFFCLPLPSYFRMKFEKRGYLASLYSINALAIRLKFPALLATQEEYFLSNFRGSTYYFMWPFSNLKKEFDDSVAKVKLGQRPFEDPIFDIIDDLVKVV